MQKAILPASLGALGQMFAPNRPFGPGRAQIVNSRALGRTSAGIARSGRIAPRSQIRAHFGRFTLAIACSGWPASGLRTKGAQEQFCPQYPVRGDCPKCAGLHVRTGWRNPRPESPIQAGARPERRFARLGQTRPELFVWARARPDRGALGQSCPRNAPDCKTGRAGKPPPRIARTGWGAPRL